MEEEILEEQVSEAAANEEKEKLLEEIAFLSTENAALKAEVENLSSQLEAAKALPNFSAKTKQSEDRFKAIREIFRK